MNTTSSTADSSTDTTGKTPASELTEATVEVTTPEEQARDQYHAEVARIERIVEQGDEWLGQLKDDEFDLVDEFPAVEAILAGDDLEDSPHVWVLGVKFDTTASDYKVTAKRYESKNAFRLGWAFAMPTDGTDEETVREDFWDAVNSQVNLHRRRAYRFRRTLEDGHVSGDLETLQKWRLRELPRNRW